MDMALVELRNGEPMTTSLAIAEGVEMEHKSVLQLLRKYLGELQTLGEVAFQTGLVGGACGNSAFEMRNSKGRPTEFAWLNEQQATFLLTLMRNSEIVVRFKLALVRAFFELRDRARLPAATTMPASVAHRADHVVSAARCFNGMMRAAQSLKLGQARAALAANQAALRHTGVDVLEELGVEPDDLPEEVPRRGVRDDLTPRLVAWLDAPERSAEGEFTSEAILAGVFGIGPEDPDYRSLATRLGYALARLGWQKRRSNWPGRPYFYRRPA